MGIGADFHRPAGLTLIHERVHVAHDGEGKFLPGFLQDRNRPDVDHLMYRRSEGDSGAGHLGDPRAPHPAGDHDVFGLDPAFVGHHRFDPPSLCFHRQHLDTGERLQRTFRLRASRERSFRHEASRLLTRLGSTRRRGESPR